MADGSSQTIDRLQVEISLNSAALNSELQSVNSQIDSTKTKLGSLETTSCSTADCIKNLGSSTSAAKSEFEKFPDTTKDAENALKALTRTSELAEKTNQAVGKSVETAGEAASAASKAFDKAGDALEDATSITDEFKKGADALTKPFDNAKKAVEKFSSALKFTGVAAAATLAFNIVKEQIDLARDAAHQAQEEVNNLQTALSSLSYNGSISIEDKAYLDKVASTTTNPTEFAELYDTIGDTLVGATKTMQQEISQAFNYAGLANGINPTQLYQSVAQTLLASGTSPNEEPEDMLKLLDLSVEASQKTGVEVTTLLKDVREYLPKLEGVNLSLEDLVKAGAYSYSSTYGDTSAFTDSLDTLLTKSQEAYDNFIANSAQSAGYDDVEEYLKSLPEETRNSIIEGAKQASKDNANTTAAGIKDGFKNIDWDEASKALGAAGISQYYAGLSSDELLDEYNKTKNTTSATYGDENGKFGLWQIFEGIDTAYANEVRDLMTKLKSGEITQSEFQTQSKALDTAKAEAVTQVWLDLPTGKLADTTKSGADYLKERTDTIGMSVSEAILYRAGNALNEIGNEVSNRISVETGEGLSVAGDSMKSIALGEPVEIPYTLVPAEGTSATEQVVSQIDLDDADKDVKNLGNETEEALPKIQEFTLEATDPLGTSVGTVAANVNATLDADALYQQSLPELQEALNGEKGTVDALATSYWNLYNAKKAAAGA